MYSKIAFLRYFYEKIQCVDNKVFDCLYLSFILCQASLPQRETSLMYRDMRRLEINRNKTMYDWHLLPAQDQLGWNLPRFCKAESFENLPLLLQNNDVHYDNFKGNREKVLLTLLVEHVSGKKINLKSILGT